MPNPRRSLRRKDITELARAAWSRVWPEPMPRDWKVYMVRKTVIQEAFGRGVCGVTLRDRKTILVGRHTQRYSFETLVHELAHLRTIDEGIDHGPLWTHEFNAVARAAFGVELRKDIDWAQAEMRAGRAIAPPLPSAAPLTGGASVRGIA